MPRIKLLLLVLVGLVFSFRIWQSTGCVQFLSFHFNPLDVKINVESQVLVDADLLRPISRFFHNKVTVGIFESTKSFASTFNPKFLLEVLGPVGLFLIILGFLNLVKKREIVNAALFSLVLAVSLFNIIFNNPKILFYSAALSWYLFALAAINYLKNIKSAVKIGRASCRERV